MRSVLIVLIVLFACSCGKQYSTSKMHLRQLLTESVTDKSTSGNFFLIVGSFSQKEDTKQIIKVFAQQDNSFYQYLEFNLSDVRFIIDNTIDTPFIVVKAFHDSDNLPDMSLIKYGRNPTVNLYCPEKYMPENISEIRLK